MTDFPTYISHKRVQAAEILSIGFYFTNGDGALMRHLDVSIGGVAHTVDVTDKVFARGAPVPGDYLVKYEDGYISFSPRKAFLDGYALAQPENVLMERLNDVSMAGPGVAPTWLQGPDWSQQLARVAREAYVTINSLKQRIENLERKTPPPLYNDGKPGIILGPLPERTEDEKTDPDQS